MQLDLILDIQQAEGHVKQAHLRPISKYVNFVPVVDERIMDRPHQLNIKRFYEKTRSGFYEQHFEPRLKSDWPMMISAAEMPNLKYIKEFDDTYFAGCQRMSYKLYGCTHEILVPVWLDHCYGLRFNIYFDNSRPTLNGGRKGVAPYKIVIDISKEYLAHNDGMHKFHQDFTKYLMDYFDYVNITSGSNNVMSVDFKQNISTISGLLVESGNYNVRQNLNISKNLLFRERPLLESNSLITNTFMDYKMIAAQLINFNLCFNLNELIDSMAIQANGKFERSNVWVEVDYIEALRDNKDIVYFDDPDFENCTGYWWKPLPLADFYTNHHYLPKQMIQPVTSSSTDQNSYNDSQYPRNILDYKMDFSCTDLVHKNKMSQSICHWYYADTPESMLFNVYDGFGAYNVKSGAEYRHGYGATPDPNDNTYDGELDNTLWCGVPHINSDQTMVNILNAPWDWVNNGYFKNAAGYINGIRFAYDDATIGYNAESKRNAPMAVYLGTATTPFNYGMFQYWTAQSNVLSGLRTVAILTDRVSNPGGASDLPIKQYNEHSKKDRQRDWHRYSDMDNRFVIRKKSAPELRAYYDPTGEYLLPNKWIWLPEVDADHISESIVIANGIKNPQYQGDISRNMLTRIGGYGEVDASYRNEDNANGLFITYLRTPVENDTKVNRPNNPLFVIFETKRNEGLTNVAENIVYKNLDASAITLGGIRDALHNYWAKYGPMIKIINLIVEEEDDVDAPTDLPDMDDLELIVKLMTNIEMPEVLYFHNSIAHQQDITISTQAHEHNYYKIGDANEYVWRYSGAIKPAIFPVIWNKDIPRVHRSDSHKLIYNGWYGRNFLWHKEPIFTIGQSLPVGISRYINKNIRPCYPSLDYDAVKELAISDSKRPTVHGDMMYDEIPPIYLGLLVNDSGQLIDRHSFTVDDFGFESMDGHGVFSFASQILGQSLDDFKMPDPNNPDNSPSTKFYYLNPDYNKSARLAVRENRFNINSLTNRTNNYIGYWLFADQYETYEWGEFKWFNKSYVLTLPLTWSKTIEADNNDKAAIENETLNLMLNDIKNSSKYPQVYDAALLRASYDFNYNLQKIEPENGKPLYKYKYIVTAILK